MGGRLVMIEEIEGQSSGKFNETITHYITATAKF